MLLANDLTVKCGKKYCNQKTAQYGQRILGRRKMLNFPIVFCFSALMRLIWLKIPSKLEVAPLHSKMSEWTGSKYLGRDFLTFGNAPKFSFFAECRPTGTTGNTGNLGVLASLKVSLCANSVEGQIALAVLCRHIITYERIRV